MIHYVQTEGMEKQCNYWTDIDSVIADFENHFYKFLRLSSHDAVDWHDPRFKDNLYKVENNEDFWLGIPPLFNPDPSIRDFRPSGYCTARVCSDETTRFWLKMCMFPEAPIINVGEHGNKGVSLKQTGCQMFLDDSIRNFQEVNEQGIDCYLMTRPHNLGFRTSKRVSNIDEFLSLVHDRQSSLDLHQSN